MGMLEALLGLKAIEIDTSDLKNRERKKALLSKKEKEWYLQAERVIDNSSDPYYPKNPLCNQDKYRNEDMGEIIEVRFNESTAGNYAPYIVHKNPDTSTSSTGIPKPSGKLNTNTLYTVMAYYGGLGLDELEGQPAPLTLKNGKWELDLQFMVAAVNDSQPLQTPDEDQSQSGVTIPTQKSNISEPDPLSFSGSGQTVINDVEIIGGLTIVEGHHDGANNFIIKLVPSEAEFNEIFINDIGKFDGTVADLINAGTYQIDVSADGNWDLNVRQPRPSSAESLPNSLSGEGSVIEGPISFNGNHTASGSHSGQMNFHVHIYPTTGDYGELVFNEIGEFEGETTFRHTGIGFVNIRADGEWKLNLE